MRMTQARVALANTTRAVQDAAKELGILAPDDTLSVVPAGDARVPGIWASIVTAEGEMIAPPFLTVGFDGRRSYVAATTREADAVMTAVHWTLHTMIHKRFRA